jgi:hypothetical protein
MGSQDWHAASNLTEVLEEINALLAAVGWDQSFETEQGGSISVVCITLGLVAAVGCVGEP